MAGPARDEGTSMARRLAAWHATLAGREVFRVAAGPGWVRLHLAGDERAALVLADQPPFRGIFRHDGRLPAPLDRALPAAPRHALVELLGGARLTGCGLLPGDRVAALRFVRPDNAEFVLLHRMFGARGNTVLLDRRANLLWSVHRPPHAALAAWPPDATWAPAPDPVPGPDADDARDLADLTRACADRLAAELGAAVARRRKAAARLVGNLARDLANADAGDRHRRKAETLAAHLHTLRQGADSVELPDLVDGTPLEIALDPALPPHANLDAWFRRARKAAKGLEIIRERHAAAVAEEEKWEAAAAGLETVAVDGPDADPTARLAALQAWRDDHAELEPRPRRARAHGPEEPARPFRRYLVDGVWEVWIGRSNTENDELTHRASHAKDIWLHAQGVPGSHVILRTGGRPDRVPRTVLAKAAALAALHSKARHAELVPVIHTERRYVRKPRKSPAGTAVCLRDSNLFVRPEVPAGVEPA